MEKQVHFKNHLGEKLMGTLHSPEKPLGGGIIIGHCFTCSRHTRVLQQMGRDLAAAGFAVLRFDFSGNGQSEGAFTDSSYSKHVEEMKAAAGLLADTGAGWIGLAGHSLGAAIALLAAAQMDNVRAVCMLAGRFAAMEATHFLSGEQQAEMERTGRFRFKSRSRDLELTKDFFADAKKYDLPRLLSTLRRPLLVIHGDQDEIIPVEEALQAHRRNPDAVTLAVIRGADHMFSGEAHRRQVAETVVAWFSRQKAGGRGD